VSNKQAPLSYLGKLDSCKISKNHSLLIKHEDIDIDMIVENLKGIITDVEDLEEYDKTVLNKRIENLTAKASIIRVGGKSEIEMKERKDRYDDAVLAVACALEEGIVEGGGIALQRMQINLQLDYSSPEDETEMIVQSTIISCLSNPIEQINKNGCKISTLDGDMFKKNIIDPLKVTRCALENAVSVAKTVLSTDCIVLNPSVWN